MDGQADLAASNEYACSAHKITLRMRKRRLNTTQQISLAQVYATLAVASAIRENHSG